MCCVVGVCCVVGGVLCCGECVVLWGVCCGESSEISESSESCES